jgi:beta-N-acetylhexosaminidase
LSPAIRPLGITLLNTLRAVAVVAATIAASSATYAATLDQMAGQMILLGFQGDQLADKSIAGLRDDIAKGDIGGIMYLKTNVKSIADVKTMNAAFLAANPALPPFISLDQEGGKVQRLTKDVGFGEIPSAADVAAADTPQAAQAVYLKVATSLAADGFNVNFGPVVDLNINPNNPIIGKYGRSFSKDPDKVTAYAEAFINAHHQAGVLTALKHFPGHGSSSADSHKGFVDITNTWNKVELAPYTALIGANMTDFVMVGHLYDKNYDPRGDTAQLPASLNPVWIGDVLRNQLGYKGVVISDDLEMGAIRNEFNTQQTVIRAVNAGVDVLLFSNTAAYSPSLGDKIRGILVAEANRDPAFKARIVASYNRIVALKAKLTK